MSKLRLAVLFLCAAFAMGAQAQNWPAKPVAMVNPFAPGGGVDTFGRPLAAYLSKTVGQQFIVEAMDPNSRTTPVTLMLNWQAKLRR